jgi:hypothetical protein
LICVDGYTVYYTNKFTTTSWIWTFDKNGDWNDESTESSQVLDYDLSDDLCDDYYDYDNDTYKSQGTWDLIEGNTKLELSENGSSTKGTYNIIELREKEMKLEGKIDGDLIKVTLVKR